MPPLLKRWLLVLHVLATPVLVVGLVRLHLVVAWWHATGTSILLGYITAQALTANVIGLLILRRLRPQPPAVL